MFHSRSVSYVTRAFLVSSNIVYFVFELYSFQLRVYFNYVFFNYIVLRLYGISIIPLLCQIFYTELLLVVPLKRFSYFVRIFSISFWIIVLFIESSYLSIHFCRMLRVGEPAWRSFTIHRYDNYHRSLGIDRRSIWSLHICKTFSISYSSILYLARFISRSITFRLISFFIQSLKKNVVYLLYTCGEFPNNRLV